MSDIVEAQMWNVTVMDSQRSIGYSVITRRGALVSMVEEIALEVSEEQGPNREITAIQKSSKVYTRRVLHE